MQTFALHLNLCQKKPCKKDWFLILWKINFIDMFESFENKYKQFILTFENNTFNKDYLSLLWKWIIWTGLKLKTFLIIGIFTSVLLQWSEITKAIKPPFWWKLELTLQLSEIKYLQALLGSSTDIRNNISIVYVVKIRQLYFTHYIHASICQSSAKIR